MKHKQQQSFWGLKPVRSPVKKDTLSINSKPVPYWFNKPLSKSKYRSGMSVHLFGDKDRDGFMNVADCKPLDRKKHMAFKQNDAGRCQAGFKGNARDCFTRAYAITEGKGYKETYDELQEKFKKMKPLKGKRIIGSGVSNARTGVYKEHAEQILKERGYKWKATSGIGKGFQMHVKEGELPKGKHILSVSKHYVASEDDDWYDTSDPSRNETRGVYGHWQKPDESFERDTDGDGVVDAADCEPLNPDAQGASHMFMKEVAQQIGSRGVDPKNLNKFHREVHGEIKKLYPKDYKQVGKTTKVMSAKTLVRTLAKNPELYSRYKKANTRLAYAAPDIIHEKAIKDYDAIHYSPEMIKEPHHEVQVRTVIPIKANLKRILKHEIIHAEQPEEMKEERKIIEKQIGRKLKYEEMPTEEEAYRLEAEEERDATPEPEVLQTLDDDKI